ncbi:uncharacterized protein ACN2A1_011735 isoform 1-T1 [Glossina fuscipes fuscipes]
MIAEIQIEYSLWQDPLNFCLPFSQYLCQIADKMCDKNCENLIDLSLEDEKGNSETQRLVIVEKDVVAEVKDTKNPFDVVFASPLSFEDGRLGNDPFDDILRQADERNDPFEMLEREARLKAKQLIKHPPVEGNLVFLDNMYSKVDPPINSEIESPSMALSEILFPENVACGSSSVDSDSATGSSAETSENTKLKKTSEYRKRLLKSTLSKAMCNSPVTKKLSLDEQELLGTPTSFNLSKSSQFGEPLLSAESPLKLIDDDIISDEPGKRMNAEQLFEADLEMLKIPILDELPSLEKENVDKIDDLIDTDMVNAKGFNGLPDLEAIKEKLKIKRGENVACQQNINSLIFDLKSLIINEGVTDEDKKRKAADILETLSSALSHSHETEEHKDSTGIVEPIISPMQRQGTFDIELQKNSEKDEQPLINEMHDSMVSCSATYNEETKEGRAALKLPEIAPLSPPPLPKAASTSTQLSKQNDINVNDVVEQISKLLEQSNNEANLQNNHNPTFILVMNTPRAQKVDSASSEGASFRDLSPDCVVNSNGPRRRAQSLSLSDQVKIVKLPLKSRTPDSKQSGELAPVNTTPPIKDEELKGVKTPARIMRRNSFSSNTSRTTDTAFLRPIPRSDGKSNNYVRRTQPLETHPESIQQQQQPIVKPILISKHSMPKFKPVLRKRSKSNAESIMKSSAPLKATLPVKKIAPLTKPNIIITPDQSIKSQMSQSSLRANGSVHLTPKPMGASVSSIGHPKASSTPTVLVSPIKRNASATKVRNTRLSIIPNSKSSTLSINSDMTALRRRTISEFKAKSPHKPKVSGASSSSSRPSMGAPRLPIVKPINKTTSTGTISKTTNRAGSRASVSGALSRNKENKRP